MRPGPARRRVAPLRAAGAGASGRGTVEADRRCEAGTGPAEVAPLRAAGAGASGRAPWRPTADVKP